jgi:hypothetical protein
LKGRDKLLILQNIEIHLMGWPLWSVQNVKLWLEKVEAMILTCIRES